MFGVNPDINPKLTKGASYSLLQSKGSGGLSARDNWIYLEGISGVYLNF